MMAWLEKILGKKSVDFPVVWDEKRISIYHWLSAFAQECAPLPDAASALPDEPEKNDNEIRWMSGALDGVMAFHFGGAEEKDTVVPIVASIQSVLRRNNATNIKQLYDLLNEDSPLAHVDELLSAIPQTPDISADRLRELVEWLAMESPDRNVVKHAMAMLAYFPTSKSEHILSVLGGHDEFTLFAIVAMRSIVPEENFDATWLRMTQRVEGWGRVHLVQRLPDPMSEHTRHWLLRTGYTNSVMLEYTAWNCATSGQLLRALEEEPDDELLLGACYILQALIMGGPARDISDYDDAAKTCLRYLCLLLEYQPKNLEHYLTVHDIHCLAEEKSAAESWEPKLSQKLLALSQEIMAAPFWDELIRRAFIDDSSTAVFLAARVSKLRGIEPWPELFARQHERADENHWYSLMQTDDSRQVQQTIELFMQQFNLSRIATGAAEQLGFGPEWNAHRALDSILQELSKFPGIGEKLIIAGMQSPMTRNRQMALNALEKWPDEIWSEQMKIAFAECVKVEPSSAVRERLSTWKANISNDHEYPS